ncbi:MAG: sigma-70 family RNA polymerase sigma factor [Butyricicoccus pullicaecorum]
MSTGESDFCLLDTLSSGSPEEDITTRISLQQAISKLPSRLAQVIAMRYGREMTQQQTARVLGVSQVQISRLEHKAVDLLRQELIS